VNFYLMSTLDF